MLGTLAGALQAVSASASATVLLSGGSSCIRVVQPRAAGRSKGVRTGCLRGAGETAFVYAESVKRFSACVYLYL